MPYSSTSAPTPTLDAFSKLPSEILQSIFLSLSDSPPPALSRRLLPYTRAARFNTVELRTFDQLERFHTAIAASPGVGALVREFSVELMDSTETVMSKLAPTLRELVLKTFALITGVREVRLDWISAAVLLSEEAANGATLRSLQTIRLQLLLAQLNSSDFIVYRLSLLSRFPASQLEIMVLPYDVTATQASMFELFPAQTATPDTPLTPLDMTPISSIDALTLVGALCDQRVVNVLRAFTNLTEITLLDSFASPHISPILEVIEPSSLRTLRLQRLIATPPPINLPLPPPPVEWTRFAALEELILGMPLCNDDLPPLLAALPSLRRIAFGSTSNPSALQVRALLTTVRPPQLQSIVLSHVSGSVGAPISAASLPSIALWLQAARVAQSDPTSTITPIFPLLDWSLPSWSPDFTSEDAEALFPLAREVGIFLTGSVVSACLTTFTLERQLDVWAGEMAAELDEEEREALEKSELWDALAVRHRGRLLGEEVIVESVRGGGGDSMGA